MGVYDIQFTLEDVIARVLKDKDKFVSMLDKHSLESPIGGLNGAIQVISQGLSKAQQDYNITCEQASEKIERIEQHKEIISKTYEIFTDMSLLGMTDEEIKILFSSYYASITALSHLMPCSGTVVDDSFFVELEQKSHVQTENIEKARLFFRDLETDMDAETRIITYTANRIFSPNFAREAYHLAEDVRGVCREYRDICANAGIGLDVYLTDEIEVCEDLSMLVVEQLIRNAMQHAFRPMEGISRDPKKNEIFVGDDVKKEAEYKGMYILTVSDNGYGIRPEHIAHMFEQGFSTKEGKNDVNGFGLYMARERLRKHGGDLTFKTAVGKGTSFTMTLPFEGHEYTIYKQKIIAN